MSIEHTRKCIETQGRWLVFNNKIQNNKIYDNVLKNNINKFKNLNLNYKKRLIK